MHLSILQACLPCEPMKALLILPLLLCGCASSRNIATILHADGSGYTTYKYITAGGIIRPGVIVIVAETVGSNAPVVLTQASGSPILPSAVQMSGMVGAAATLGATLRPDEHNSSTTLNTVETPSTPKPSPVRPPFGPPPWHGQHPRNKGH